MADLISLAQNKAINSALLISGDADLTPGVSAAQTLGVRVYRLEISGQEASSPVLCEEVDRNCEWPRVEVENFACKAVNATQCCVPAEDKDEQSVSLDDIALLFWDEINTGQQQEVRGSLSISSHLDKKLLFIARTNLNRFLSPEETKELRSKVKSLA